MDTEKITAKIAELEQQWQDLQKQAESALTYIKGQIDAYREILAQLEGEKEPENKAD